MTILTKSKKHKIFDEIGKIEKVIIETEDTQAFMEIQQSLVNIAGELYSFSELKKAENHEENNA